MGGQIVPNAAARTRLLAPAVAYLRTEAIKMRFKEGYFSERPVSDQRFHGQEIAVPTAVMKHGEQFPEAFRQRVQLPGL